MNIRKQFELVEEINTITFVLKRNLSWDEFVKFKSIGRLSKQHHAICFDYCNGMLSPNQENNKKLFTQYLNRKELQIVQVITELNRMFMCRQKQYPEINVKFESDPNKQTVKIYFGLHELFYLPGVI